MGQRAKILELRGLLGSDAKSTVDTIITLQASWNTVDVILQAHGVTWLNQVEHYITGFSYELQSGTTDSDGAQKVQFHMVLARKTYKL